MSEPTAVDGPASREVALPPGERAVIVAGGAILGLVVGALLPLVAGRLAELSFVPARDLLAWTGELATGRPWFPPVSAALLGLVGLVLGVLAVGRASRVRVSARDVVLLADGEVQRFARSQVGEAVCEGKVLVLRDPDDVDLVRRKLDVAPDRVRAALREYGWPVDGRRDAVDDASS